MASTSVASGLSSFQKKKRKITGTTSTFQEIMSRREKEAYRLQLYSLSREFA
jgi:hypothetical protein